MQALSQPNSIAKPDEAPVEGSTDTRIDASARIEQGVCIGFGAVIGAFVRVPKGVTIGERTAIGDGVTFAIVPGGAMSVGADVKIGAGATLSDGISIGNRAEIAPGAVVTRSVPAYAVVQGNPATIVRYVDAATRAVDAHPASTSARVENVGVGAVAVHQFPIITDIRGSLTVGEFDREIPFVPLRYFMVFDVPNRETRGEHAHRACHQFLVCVRGSCAVVVDDGQRRSEIVLDSPAKGVHLPPMTWGIQYKYSADALLLVFASHHYDSADYIRDYPQFLSEAGGAAGG